MKKSRFLLLLLVGVLLTGVNVQVAAQESEYSLSECAFTIPLGMNIQCGYLTVPADHAQPEGATIQLALAVLKSSSSTPEPDPLVFLQGGPGGSAIQLELLGAMPRLFTLVLRDRDIILLDQRGTGLSQPSLTCPEMVAVLEQNSAPMIGGALSGDMLPALRQCRDRLEGEGVHLSDYTTYQSAADVAMLREAMGFDQINLFGISYGTRLALEIMRRYPEGIRSVILDSVLPPNVDVAAEESANTAAAFELVFERCASDTQCRLAYPDLRSAFFDLIDSANRQPLTFSAIHPRTDQPVEITLAGDQLVEMMFGLLYSTEGVAHIPALVYEIRGGEYEHLESMIFPNLDVRLAGLSSPAMQYSVICNDILPPAQGTESGDGNSGAHSIFTNAGSFSNGQIQSLCAEWDTSEAASATRQPVTSEIPTLLLVGEIDHATPVSWAERAAETLSNSFVYVFPGASHALMNTQPECLASISSEFLNAPDSPPVTTCMSNLRPPTFAVTAIATRPIVQASALLLGGVALWGTGITGVMVARRRQQFAWRMSFRLMGWIGVAASIGGILFLMLGQDDGANPFSFANSTRAVEAVIALVVGVQAAFAFSPEDEPSLEVQLACPRPVGWLLLERLLVILFVQTIIALIGTVISMAVGGERDVLIALARWVVPMLFFAGVGAYTTIKSRQPAFSVAITGVLWFIFSFMGAVLLPGLPTFWPLSIIQPYLWPLHAFLQPGDMSARDYWLNRAVVASIGIGLMMLALRGLRDEERVLFGGRSRRWLRSAE